MASAVPICMQFVGLKYWRITWGYKVDRVRIMEEQTIRPKGSKEYYKVKGRDTVKNLIRIS